MIGDAAGKACVSFVERQYALAKLAGLKVLEPIAD